jgi:MFS family permease
MNIYMFFYVSTKIEGIEELALSVSNLFEQSIATTGAIISSIDENIGGAISSTADESFWYKFFRNFIEDPNAGINSFAFLVRDLVGALLPVLVLNVVANKTGMAKTHTGSILLMALGYGLIYFFGTNIIVFFASLCIVGIGWASLVSLPFAIMSERVDQSKMGLYMGIFNLSVVLPQLVASFKMGEVINAAADKSIIFAICAVCLAISGILWISVKDKK